MTRLRIRFRFIALALALTALFPGTHSLYLASRSERNAQPAKEARTPTTNANELVASYTLHVRQNHDLSEKGLSIEERMLLPEPGSGSGSGTGAGAEAEAQSEVDLEAQVVLSAMVCRMSHSLVRTGLGDSQGVRLSRRRVKDW